MDLNDDEENNDDRRLQRYLECPVCLKVRLGTPIFTCKIGHHICAVCKTAKESLAAAGNNNAAFCPTCKGGYNNPPTRNFAMESLIEDSDDLDFSCRFDGCKCKFSGKRVFVGDHETVCEERLVPCPDCGGKVKARDIVQHIRDSHDETEWRDGETFSWVDWHVGAGREDWVLVINEYRGHKFVLRFAKVDGIYYAWIVVIGDRFVARNFTAEISVGLPFSCKVHAIDETEEDILKEMDGSLQMTHAQVRRCLSVSAAPATDGIRATLTVEYSVWGVGGL